MGTTSKRPTKKQLKTTAFRSKKKVREVIQEAFPEQEPPEQEDVSPQEEQAITKKRKRLVASKQSVPVDKEEEEEEEGDPSQQPDSITSSTAAKRRKRKNAAKLRHRQEEDAAETKRQSKLILFVGNLPFDMSAERLKSFFKEHCGEEPAVRLMTRKADEGPSTGGLSGVETRMKGCGFIEFGTSGALQKALKLHHTLLSGETEGNGRLRPTKPRRINIELTAGGGGSSQNRRQKILLSHARLAKQRQKIAAKKIKAAESLTLQPKPTLDLSIKKLPSSRPPIPQNPKSLSSSTRKPNLSGANAIRLG